MKRFIPYPTLVGDVSLEIREARLDGIPLHLGMISGSHRMIALHQVERSAWEEARLNVRLKVPQAELDSPRWSEVTCVIVAAERRTQTRTVTPLRHESDDGLWTGTVTLHRDHHVGQVDLSGHVVATVGGVAGRAIGSTEHHWTVDLKARRPLKQREMRIVSVNFADEAHPHLHPYRNDPWSVDASADEPIVYLNTGFEGLTHLLHSSDRAVRNALSAQIAADAWTAMFSAAVYAAGAEDGQPVWPGGWRDSVLRRMLPDMFPDRSPDDALFEVVTRRDLGEGGGDLQTRLLHAAGRQAMTPRHLGGFIRMFDRKEYA